MVADKVTARSRNTAGYLGSGVKVGEFLGGSRQKGKVELEDPGRLFQFESFRRIRVDFAQIAQIGLHPESTAVPWRRKETAAG